MANPMTNRIRPGASVECTDGRLGSFDGLEHDADGNPEIIRVRRGWTNQEILVPADLVREVRSDGSVQLACAKEDLEYATRNAAPERSRGLGADQRPEAHLEPTARVDWLAEDDRPPAEPAAWEQTVELRQEELVAHKELREVGDVEVRKEIEEVPGRLEVESYREEIEVEHVPVGRIVSERVEPWEEDGVMIVPVYEEQLVVTKRLVLREQLRVRRVGTVETQLFEDTLRRERVVVDDPANTGLIREQYPADEDEQSTERRGERGERKGLGGLFGFGSD
jgi:uncharacterized protein (TIGR02271 family)